MRHSAYWVLFLGLGLLARTGITAPPIPSAPVQPDNDFFKIGGFKNPAGDNKTAGEWWSPGLPTDPRFLVQAIHAALLPDGKVIVVNGSAHRNNTNGNSLDNIRTAALFDPSTCDKTKPTSSGFVKLVDPAPPGVTGPTDIDLFCGGHAHLPDGNVLFVGGTSQYDFSVFNGKRQEIGDFRGNRQVWIFDWKTAGWIEAKGPDGKAIKLTDGRWYPTLIELGDGRIMILAGKTQEGRMSSKFEFFRLNPDGRTGTLVAQDWAGQPAAPMSPGPNNPGSLDLYTRSFLMNDGRILVTGDGAGGDRLNRTSNLLTVNGNLATWSFGPQRFDLTKMYSTGIFDPANPGSSDVLLIGGAIGGAWRPEFRLTSDNNFNNLENVPVQQQRRTVPEMTRYHAQLNVFDRPVENFLAATDQSTNGTPIINVDGAGFGRVNHHAVILPTGQFLVMGGGSYAYHHPFFHPILYTPSANGQALNGFTRKIMNPSRYSHLYHMGSLLLPDGRVLLMGGQSWRATLLSNIAGAASLDQKSPYNQATGRDLSPELPGENQHFEIFSPPYLFNGARPVISNAPTMVGHNQQISLTVQGATLGGKVTLLRLGSITHGFDANQKYHELSQGNVAANKAQGNTTLAVTSPANGNIAPPGMYMLFYVNAAGVPSVAKMIRLTN